MGRTILVPVDGSRPSRRAVEYAIEHFPDASITLMYVMDPMIDYGRRRAFPGYREDDEFVNEREKGEHVFEDLLAQVPEGIDVETELLAGEPARAIVRFAEEQDVDGIGLGSHGRQGAARYLLGSVAELVVRRSPVPVTVVRSNG